LYTVSFPKDELGSLMLKMMVHTDTTKAMEKEIECAVCLMYVKTSGKECPKCEKITCLECYNQLQDRNDIECPSCRENTLRKFH